MTTNRRDFAILEQVRMMVGWENVLTVRLPTGGEETMPVRWTLTARGGERWAARRSRSRLRRTVRVRRVA